jgi:hypothetical protein
MRKSTVSLPKSDGRPCGRPERAREFMRHKAARGGINEIKSNSK